LITRYQGRISGPLLDRIDIHLEVPRVDYDKLMGVEPGEPSASVRERVERARERQRERFSDHPGLHSNADMKPGEIRTLCILTSEARQLLEVSVKRMQMSARAYHRVLKLSRTIADLAGCERIEIQHVAEAIQYRPKSTVF
jgi:magnesium chelatase family protein